jgi:AcrR family transcriptional regulator
MKKQERMKKEKELRKNIIINSAMKTFARLGYDGTTMNDIAKEAGYSKANMYFYFRDKQQVFKEMFSLMLTENNEMRTSIIKDESNPEQKLGKMIDLTFRYMESHRDIIRIMHSEQNKVYKFVMNKEFHASMVKDRSSTIECISQILETGIKNGLFRKVDTHSTAVIFMGMMGAAIGESLMSHEKSGVEIFRDRITDILFTGIKK